MGADSHVLFTWHASLISLVNFSPWAKTDERSFLIRPEALSQQCTAKSDENTGLFNETQWFPWHILVPGQSAWCTFEHMWKKFTTLLWHTLDKFLGILNEANLACLLAFLNSLVYCSTYPAYCIFRSKYVYITAHKQIENDTLLQKPASSSAFQCETSAFFDTGWHWGRWRTLGVTGSHCDTGEIAGEVLGHTGRDAGFTAMTLGRTGVRCTRAGVRWLVLETALVSFVPHCRSIGAVEY